MSPPRANPNSRLDGEPLEVGETLIRDDGVRGIVKQVAHQFSSATWVEIDPPAKYWYEIRLVDLGRWRRDTDSREAMLWALWMRRQVLSNRWE